MNYVVNKRRFISIGKSFLSSCYFGVGKVYYKWPGGNLEGYQSADSYVGFSYDSYVKRLDIYVDESGNFAPYNKQNPVYSVAFIFAERNTELQLRSEAYRRNLSSLPCGNHFVHVGNLVRGKPPYESLTGKERQNLFYALFMFTKRLDICFYSFHVFKNAVTRSTHHLSAKIAHCIEEMLNEHHQFFDKYDQIIIHYDNGQLELSRILQSSLLTGLPCKASFIETRQMEDPIMQVADMICYLETLSFKLKEGHATNSDLAFFGPTKGDINKKYINPLRKKRL